MLYPGSIPDRTERRAADEGDYSRKKETVYEKNEGLFQGDLYFQHDEIALGYLRRHTGWMTN